MHYALSSALLTSLLNKKHKIFRILYHVIKNKLMSILTADVEVLMVMEE